MTPVTLDRAGNPEEMDQRGREARCQRPGCQPPRTVREGVYEGGGCGLTPTGEKVSGVTAVVCSPSKLSPTRRNLVPSSLISLVGFMVSRGQPGQLSSHHVHRV